MAKTGPPEAPESASVESSLHETTGETSMKNAARRAQSDFLSWLICMVFPQISSKRCCRLEVESAPRTRDPEEVERGLVGDVLHLAAERQLCRPLARDVREPERVQELRVHGQL